MMEQGTPCPGCGHIIPYGFRFCTECGVPLPPTANRISTGNEQLDAILGGGFKRGKTFLIAGKAGTGKTIFSLQYLLHGANNGEPGIYVTVDEKPETLLDDAMRFGWNLYECVQKKKLFVFPLRKFFAFNGWHRSPQRRLDDTMKHLGERVKEIGAKRLAIDPIAPLVGRLDDLSLIREYVRALVLSIEDTLNTTTILTSEIPTDATNALSRYGVEEFLTSGVIVLDIEKDKDSYTRTLTIPKMRWTDVQPSTYLFEIIQGRGLVIDGKKD
jgi:circadian clock protein KaiC